MKRTAGAKKLRNKFNAALDALVRPELALGDRTFSVFHFCGGVGLLTAVTQTVALASVLNLSQGMCALITVVACLTFLALALVVKVITGEERLVYYHHQLAVLLTISALLWVVDAPLLSHLDIAILGVGTFLVCGRAGCLMAGCCHGLPSSIGPRYGQAHCVAGFPGYLEGVRVFPVQLLDAMVALAGVIAGLLAIAASAPAGTALASYLVVYACGRFLIEFLRGDPDRVWLAGFTESQWISIGLVASVIVLQGCSLLPLHAWHLAASVLLMLGMCVVAWLRRRGHSRPWMLLHPDHIREVAGALDLLATVSSRQRDGSVHMACTSQAVRISYERLDSVELHTLSMESGPIPGTAATALAKLISRLRRRSGRTRLIPARPGLFHLLTEPRAQGGGS